MQWNSKLLLTGCDGEFSDVQQGQALTEEADVSFYHLGKVKHHKS